MTDIDIFVKIRITFRTRIASTQDANLAKRVRNI